MAKRKRAWNMSNPLYRYLHGGKKAKKSNSRVGGNMARKRRGARRSGGGFGGGNMIDAGLKGMGIAAVAKRFVGAPLGGFTGAAAGYLMTKSLYGAIGGYVHDNIGNSGSSSSGSGGVV